MGGERAVNATVAAKRALRLRVSEARAAVPPGEREALGAVLCERLLALPEVAGAAVVAAYVGVGTEPPTTVLLSTLAARGVTVLLPVLEADASLSWGVHSGTLVPGRLGLLSPPSAGAALAGADVVVVPGVAFDAAGRRLGRGGGSYDRALRGVTVPVVAAVRDEEVVAEVPVEPHDRPVDVVVTPTRVLRPGTTEPGAR
ncbi:MAG TPA: 5-formyltetrahydrofolate cyclo-ligase [Mycobacteriales bacterium]|nr:5-formyltetrahydrofolate cyclo-ligase [Mycobacteriales bacterium]